MKLPRGTLIASFSLIDSKPTRAPFYGGREGEREKKKKKKKKETRIGVARVIVREKAGEDVKLY